MNIKKFLKDEKGATLPFVAIILSLFALGFTALVVDAGTLYVQRKAMVTAADAAALAGAQVLREYELANMSESDAETEAEAKAIEYAIANGADTSLVQVFAKKDNVTLPSGEIDNRWIVDATVGKNEPLIFARFLGDNSADVKAHAIGTWGYIKKTYIGNFIPLFAFDTDYQLDTNVFLHEKMKNSNSYGFINIGSGMGDIKEAIAGKSIGGMTIYDNCLEGKPGAGEAVYKAVVDRMIMAQGKTTPEERRKAMIGLVPIINYAEFIKPERGNVQYNEDGSIRLDVDGYMILNSKLSLPIDYFASFEIIDVIKQGETVGSEEALNPGNQYTKIGKPSFEYSVDIPTNLLDKNKRADNTIVLGRFTGETVAPKALIDKEDQINPNPEGDPPATYSKLIK